MSAARSFQRAPDVVPPRLEPRSAAGLVPPHDLEAEAVVIAAGVDTSARRGNPRDTALGLVSSRDFYSEDNARIWAAVEDLAASNRPTNIPSICGWLEDRGKLGDRGKYLRELISNTPATGNLVHYAERVGRLARRRRMIAEFQRLAAEGYDAVDDGDAEWCDYAAAAVDQLTHSAGPAGYSGRSLLDFTRLAFEDVNKRAIAAERGEALESGLTTNLPDVDRVMGELMPGNLILIGASTGVGKSTLARQFMTEWNLRGRGGYVASLEMSGEEVAKALLFTRARIDSSLLGREVRIDMDGWDRLAESAKELYEHARAIWIDDRADMSVDDLSLSVRAHRRACERMGVPFSFIIVDYVQLMASSRVRKASSREEEVSAIGRGLKMLAARERVVCVALAQLNAEADKRVASGGRPRLSDLRESKALAQHANKVLFVHNPNVLARSESSGGADEDGEEAEIIVAKNRGGRLGPVKVRFRPQWTCFESAAETWRRR